MTKSETTNHTFGGPEARVLVMAGTGSGGDAVTRVLGDGNLPCFAVADAGELRREAERGAGAVFIPAAGLDKEKLQDLEHVLERGARLAELPIFIIDHPESRNGSKAILERLRERPNVTLFDPAPSDHALLAAARAALRERHRQAYVHRLLGRIEEAERREERLLAGLGHELRNPLAVIATTLSVMRGMEEVEGPLARHCETMERQVDALARRVDELLDTSRGTSEHAHTREWPPAEHAGNGGAEADGERSGAETAPHAPVSHARILVVEDHDDGRAALVELLEMWGYDVEGARDGLEGVERARHMQPAVALVDIDLPEIDGYEVARRIREEREGEPVHLIAMSGFGQPEDRRRALAAGFDRHLVKPVDPQRLADLLEESFRVGAA
ncbi:MAG TPA: response regulator [Thermoanaerobaculia bacterium]|nr:response regulator [Thermoanaerobaculia bacterium]